MHFLRKYFDFLLMVAPLTTSATRRLKYNLCDRVGGGRKSSFQQNTLMTRVVPAAAMRMEWDKDVEYPPETASRWLSCVRESLTTIYFTPNMLEWYFNWILLLMSSFPVMAWRNPLPEPVLAKISVVIWRHLAISWGINVLTESLIFTYLDL